MSRMGKASARQDGLKAAIMSRRSLNREGLGRIYRAPRAHRHMMGTLRLDSLPTSGHGSESLGCDQRSRPFGWTGSALPILRVECQHDLESDHSIRVG